MEGLTFWDSIIYAGIACIVVFACAGGFKFKRKSKSKNELKK